MLSSALILGNKRHNFKEIVHTHSRDIRYKLPNRSILIFLKPNNNYLLVVKSGSRLKYTIFQMYSAVYKCVCKQFSDRLYYDVMDHVGTIINRWSENLLRSHERISPELELSFVNEFHLVLSRYFHALGSIVPIFTYMVSWWRVA